ncbi:hypothetical protein [Micromonospora sp. 4G55]|nr:hypothetical protein [Micromonospora sp. 4G55]
MVIGARDPGQIADNVAMFQWDVPGALWADLKAEGLLAEEVPTP